MLTGMGKISSGLGAAIVLAATLAFTGCAASAPESAPTPTPTVPDTVFLDTMRSTEAFFGFKDAQLHTIGKDVCAALEDGSSFDDLVYALSINDYDKDQASTIIFASAAEYCPGQER